MKIKIFLVIFASILQISFGFFLNNIISKILSPFIEQCDSRWIVKDIDALEEDLHQHVFGQDLAVKTILAALRSHIVKVNHNKPLVLSFHGWTGGGKTYVKDFILKHWFHEGDRSKFVRTYFAERDFPRNDQHSVMNYKIRLQLEMERTINSCPRAVFVFDEVDKYPPYVLDAIKSYIDYNSHIGGYDYRKAIFILITNTGAQLITNIALHKWEQSVARENLELSDFEEPIRSLSFNDEGGFFKSDLIKHHLIDYIVPFVPLEREHVQSCIEVVLRRKEGIPRQEHDRVKKEILQEITFAPEENPLYAKRGCHNIESKVDVRIEEFRRKKLRDRIRKNEL